MKVLRVLPSIASEMGGPIRSTIAVCRAAHSVDPDLRFTLVTTCHGLDDGWREVVETNMPPGTVLKVFPAWGRPAFIFSLPLARWLSQHVELFDLVIVQTLFNPVSTLASWIARRSPVPYMVVPHGMLSRYTFRHRRTWLKRLYFRYLERRTLEGAAAVRFTARAERAEAPSWGNSIPTPVIPHPWEARYAPDAPRINEDPLQILFLSRIDPVKGIELLLEALCLLRRRVPGAHLVLAGSGAGAYERRIREEIRRLGLQTAVRLPGFVEGREKTRLLDESTLFVLPSEQENFGVAVVEAMDAGLPVVVSRNVNIWDDIEDADAGITLERRTPAALSDAMARLLYRPDMRRRMGRNGRDLVRRAYDPRTVGERLVEMYTSIGERDARRIEPAS